jgi:hypothetical protein
VAQVLEEHLQSKHKALNSTLSTAKTIQQIKCNSVVDTVIGMHSKDLDFLFYAGKL